MQKERITVTLDPDLLARIDRLAELRDESRSRMMERLLDYGVEDEEKLMASLATPLLGSIVQSIVDHPKIVAALAQAIGERLTPEEYLRWQEAGPRLRHTRKRLGEERGRRYDAMPEGA